MVDKVITLTDEQNRRAEELAREHGYESSDAYLRAVIEEALDAEITIAEIVEAVKEGIREANRGGGMSVEEFRRRMAEDD
jgi:predicted transcriptional regulator